MHYKKFLFILLFCISFYTNSYSIEPDVFVQSTVNRASHILSKDITKKEKINELKLIARETVDIKGVGFYSLGSARKALNEDQKKTKRSITEDEERQEDSEEIQDERWLLEKGRIWTMCPRRPQDGQKDEVKLSGLKTKMTVLKVAHHFLFDQEGEFMTNINAKLTPN